MPRDPEDDVAWFSRTVFDPVARAAAEYVARLVAPIGSVVRDGSMVAVVTQRMGPGAFNAMYGVTRPEQLAMVLPRYDAAGVRARVEVLPHHLDDGLADALDEQGLVLRDTRLHLVGRRPRGPGPANVEEVTDASLSQFAVIDGLAGGDPRMAEAAHRGWVDDPAIRYFVASHRGRPAAAGVLFVHESVGYLASAATDPVRRRQGLHRALIDARTRAAETPWFAARTQEDSISARNLHRAGFRLAGRSLVFEMRR